MLFSRKDFVVYQAIDAEPTKVTDNNFKDKVKFYNSIINYNFASLLGIKRNYCLLIKMVRYL